MKPTLVIPDIHGSLKMFDTIMEEYPGHDYILLGDVFDRGYEVKQVMDKIKLMVSDPDIKIDLIIGNHEAMTYNGIVLGPDSPYAKEWLFHGGNKTLTSYGEDARAALKDVVWYINESNAAIHRKPKWGPLSEHTILYAHAAKPRYNSEGHIVGEHHIWDRPDAMLEMRYIKEHQNDILSIHGHTPVTTPTFHDNLSGGYIDLGNFFSNKFAVFLPEKNEVVEYALDVADSVYKKSHVFSNFLPVSKLQDDTI